jgi:hypothetical protein
MKYFATFTSYLLHPLIIPSLSIGLIMNLPVYPFTFFPSAVFRFILTSVIINTYIIPILMMFILKKTGFLHSYHMPEKRDRIMPMMFVAVLLYITYYICNKWNLPLLVNSVLISLCCITVATIIITVFYKISLHLVGWGTFTGLLIFLFIKYPVSFTHLLPLTIIVSGLIAFARATLLAHTKYEIIAGYFWGLLSMTAILSVLV